MTKLPRELLECANEHLKSCEPCSSKVNDACLVILLSTVSEHDPQTKKLVDVLEKIVESGK